MLERAAAIEQSDVNLILLLALRDYEGKHAGALTNFGCRSSPPQFREMADMIAHDIEGIEAAQRAFVAEAEAALHLTTDTSRATIPAKALWASAHLTDKLTVQNALFPEGILYRTDIRFFEPPDNELQALVFSMLLSSVGEEEGEEIKSGRGERI